MPEDYLADVIEVIRTGIAATPTLDPDVRDGLELWCFEEEAYLHGMSDEDHEHVDVGGEG